jgi:superfamily II DNA helicase RecQ
VPDSSEAYVHRVGRTGRADELGQAITLVAPEEQRALAPPSCGSSRAGGGVRPTRVQSAAAIATCCRSRGRRASILRRGARNAPSISSAVRRRSGRLRTTDTRLRASGSGPTQRIP